MAQTTNLKISKALQAAGFWETRDREWTHTWYKGPNDEWYVLDRCLYSTVHGDRMVPAATYNNLIPALGLDKPIKCEHSYYDRQHCVGCRASGLITYHGLTCDSLGQLWLDLHAEHCKTCKGDGAYWDETQEDEAGMIIQNRITGGCSDCNGTGWQPKKGTKRE